MKLKMSTWLAVSAAGAVLLAGCGGGSSTSSQSGSGTASPGAASGTAAIGAQDVASCKRSVQAQPTLSAGARAKLEKICAKAASGNPATMQQVAHEACVELVDASHVPPGISKAEALAVCNTVKPQ